MISSISFKANVPKGGVDHQLNVYLDLRNCIGFDIDGRTDVIELDLEDLQLLVGALKSKIEVLSSEI